MLENNYVTLQGFMVEDLKLKGNELLIYALIYGFSQNQESWFKGSLDYICTWTNSTKQGVLKNIKSLIEKGLIEKIETKQGRFWVGQYRVLDRETKFNSEQETVKQSLIDRETKFNDTIKQSLMVNPINNNNNIYNNKVINTKEIKEKAIEDMFNQFWEEYPKHINKKGCLTRFKNLDNLETEFEFIMQGLKIDKQSQQWRNEQFIPYPMTWLNQERWKEKIKTYKERDYSKSDDNGGFDEI